MKTIACAVIGLIMFLAVAIFACDKGCFIYRGECACDIAPETAPVVKPSDEKPPSDKMPSYQREGVSIVDAPNMAFLDSKADQDKRDAEIQGKKAANINP